MTDPLPEDGPSGTKWLWVGVLVLLAVAAVIFFLNADGDESLETIPDEAITTTEERLNTEIAPPETESLPPVNGTEDANTIVADPTAVPPLATPTPAGTPMADTQ
ncbi:hypothetical protein [Qipengyuania spongiae]|uniref:SPOR domain-containing protein n=1 Tax=Qipengyuania spongiae TaxID=2909673 RepID=A0ABY5T3V1_9SPHN|nr:hypothetical protein [Qipengyuania spongiae]UVI40254.1 hypothetical protein L1F33_04740 [Qipengyuania spongiae]